MKFRGKPLTENALSPAIYHKIREEIFSEAEEREIFECKRKKFFRLESGAQKELEIGLSRGYLRKTAYKYKCSFCIGWHTTNGDNPREDQTSGRGS